MCKWLRDLFGGKSQPEGNVRHPSNGPFFQLVNQSTALSTQQADHVSLVCQKQARAHFAPAWHGLGKDTQIQHVPEADLDPKKWWIVVADTLEVAGALGYHDTTSEGTPIIKIAAQTTIDANMDVSSVVSHEVVETLGDPSACWWTMDARTGTFYALETADACQRDTYEIDGLKVSDFLFPAFFDADDPSGPYDYLGLVEEPLQTLPGGYQIVFRDGRVEHVRNSTEQLPKLSSRPDWR